MINVGKAHVLIRSNKITLFSSVVLALALSISSVWARYPSQAVREFRLVPTAERYADLKDVRLLWTVKNTGREPAEIELPYPADSPWPQWLRVYRDGIPLDHNASGELDIAVSSAMLKGGEQATALVSLDKFFREGAVISPGKGRYDIVWEAVGGGWEFAEGTRVQFVVLPQGNSPSDTKALSLSRLFPGIEALETRGKRQWIWRELLGSPSNPRWVELLPLLTQDLLDADSILALLQNSIDIGVRREAMRALSLVGIRPELAPILLDYLRDQKDDPTLTFGAEAYHVLKGQDGYASPASPACDARSNQSEACPLVSNQCYWTQESRWVCENDGISRAPRSMGPTELKIRDRHPAWTQKK